MSRESKPLVDKAYAKSDSYAQELERIEQVGGCPFCTGSPSYSFHPVYQPILHRNLDWFIVPVRDVEDMRWKYANAKHHYMIVAATHIEHVQDLSVMQWARLGDAVQWLCQKLECEGGGIALRFGPTRMTGASVQHLHMHFIEPEIDPDTDRAKTVNIPFG